MENTSKNDLMSPRDIAYYRQRQKNRVFTALAAFFAEEAERGGISKKKLAAKLGKDPAQITRWLSAPSNFELDTLSDILLAMGAEMDHGIVRFTERSKPNYAHPLMASYLGSHQAVTKPQLVMEIITETERSSTIASITKSPANSEIRLTTILANP